MLVVKCLEYLEETREFAQSVGLQANLEAGLDALDRFFDGNEATRGRCECHLTGSFSLPEHSFNWRCYWKRPDGGLSDCFYNGGLVYFSDGSDPGWSIHS